MIILRNTTIGDADMKLITAIKIQANCESENDFKNLPLEKKKRIADLVEERVPSGLATIDEWNEVISCFVKAKPEKDNKKAKNKLLAILREEKE